MSSLQVLFEGEGYLAVEKPPGLLVIPGRGKRPEPSARELLEQQLGRPVWVVHRLDKDTSGVLLFALDARAHRTLSMAFEGGKVHKRYQALVQGRLFEPRQIDLALAPARRGRMRGTRPGEQGKAAQTRVTPLEVFHGASLVEAEPLTGRTHQIRVHLLLAGHPLLVDPQYGQPEKVTAREVGGEGEETVLARTPLHAAHLTLPALEGIPARGLTSPLPEDMARALEVLRRPAR